MGKKVTEKKKIPSWMIILGVAVLIPILIVGYLGFMPIVSDIMGANRPKDLGIKATEEDFLSATEKLGRTRETLPSSEDPADSLKFEGSHPVDHEFTSEEITATMQTRKYRYNPISDDFQARINDDGTAEISGRIIMKNLIPYGIAAGVPEYQREIITENLGFIKVNPSFYVKGKAEVTNNNVDIDIEKAQVGKISIKPDIVPGEKLNEFAEDRIENIPGLSVEKLEFVDGKMHFKGTYPDKSYYDQG